MIAAYLTVLALFGLALGSFANVVIWRYPRGESLSTPGSHCPSCDHPVRWYDNVPVASWLLLHGRCRDCGEPISIRYPIVEFLSAALWVLAGASFGFTLRALAAIVMFYLLLILSFIDLDTMRLPNPLVVLLGVLGVVGALASLLPVIDAVPLTLVVDDWLSNSLVASLVGAALGAGVSLVIALGYQGVRKRQGFGMGDVKLLAAMGVYLGPYVLMAFFGGAVLGALWGVAGMVRGGGGMTTKFPFGPFLALGGVLTAVWGPSLFVWYLSVLGVTV